ncbi:MAG TPA: hypothetical protein VFS24_19160 [Steroidobacteraceae bacterium]|nr:hypothetical protein [Steroidobacteraceae bacterium]HEU4653641.1 hypothetical protein [Steroidobacteraceae bacterium]
MTHSKVLTKLASAIRSSVAGRRRSDEVILRALRSDSNDVTSMRRGDLPDEIQAPACPKCGARMIHAAGQRSENDEFWACSMLNCDGARQVSG